MYFLATTLFLGIISGMIAWATCVLGRTHRNLYAAEPMIAYGCTIYGFAFATEHAAHPLIILGIAALCGSLGWLFVSAATLFLAEEVKPIDSLVVLFCAFFLATAATRVTGGAEGLAIVTTVFPYTMVFALLAVVVVSCGAFARRLFSTHTTVLSWIALQESARLSAVRALGYSVRDFPFFLAAMTGTMSVALGILSANIVPFIDPTVFSLAQYINIVLLVSIVRSSSSVFVLGGIGLQIIQSIPVLLFNNSAHVIYLFTAGVAALSIVVIVSQSRRGLRTV